MNLVLPIRQTASIFKQPVTVIRTRPESKTRTDLKHGPQEPPKQVCSYFPSQSVECNRAHQSSFGVQEHILRASNGNLLASKFR